MRVRSVPTILPAVNASKRCEHPVRHGPASVVPRVAYGSSGQSASSRRRRPMPMRPSLAGRADDRLPSQPRQTPARGAVGALVFPEDGPDAGPYPSRRSDRAWASLADGIPSVRHASRCQTLRLTLPKRAFDGIRGGSGVAGGGGRIGRSERHPRSRPGGVRHACAPSRTPGGGPVRSSKRRFVA